MRKSTKLPTQGKLIAAAALLVSAPLAFGGDLPPVKGTGALGNFVWSDVNGNGLQDTGEPGIAGRTVTLQNCTGGVLTQAVTDAQGLYLFPELAAGCYRVSTTLQSGETFSPALQGGSRLVDSDITSVSGSTGVTGDIKLADGELNKTIDIGIKLPPVDGISSIGGYVFGDLNINKLMDSTEVGIPGVKVQLFNASNVLVAETLTNTFEGYYVFNKVLNGCYTVKTSSPTTGDYANGVFTTPATVSSACVNTATNTWRRVDFGLIKSQLPPLEGCVYGSSVSWWYTPMVLVNPPQSVGKLASYDLYDKSGKFLGNTAALGMSDGGVLNSGLIGTFKQSYFFPSAPVSVFSAPNPLYNIGAATTQLVGVDTYGRRTPLKTCQWSGVSPIALDTNHDGKIGVTGQSTAKDGERSQLGKLVHFDMLGNGQPMAMEWFNGDDGILVDNRDGNAAVDMNGKRLFGDQNGQFAHGYVQLAQLDQNRDGALTGAELAGLNLWFDNGDAKVQAGELKDLGAAGIVSLSTRMSLVDGMMRSSALTADGKTIMTEDVWFGMLPFGSLAQAPAAAAVATPVASWHWAAALAAGLAGVSLVLARRRKAH